MPADIRYIHKSIYRRENAENQKRKSKTCSVERRVGDCLSIYIFGKRSVAIGLKVIPNLFRRGQNIRTVTLRTLDKGDLLRAIHTLTLLQK
tara:strand:+ start:717 stop:989 length:273 start_codon:yes stop_codon:yes gene_type:complete